MPKTVTASAVPQLSFSPREAVELRQLSARLESEIVAAYEDVCGCGGRGVDAAQWKLVRSDGDVHAYKERRPPSSPSSSGLTNDRPHEALASQSTIPRLLVTGAVPGTLDDVMFGTSFQDTPAFHAYWLAQGDRMEECAVVAMLERPSVDDPYRFLGAAWLLRTFPLSANIISRRDCLCLVSTRLMTLANGDRVGVFLSHSIQHRQLAEMREFDVIRATTSTVQIYRQLDAQRVEVLMFNFLDTKGCVGDGFHVQEAIKYALPLAGKVAAAGFRKKLQWMVEHRRQEETASCGDAIEPMSSGSCDACELCSRPVRRFFSSAGTTCSLCYKTLCSRCRASHELAVVVSPTKTAFRSVDFCIDCVLQARARSTLEVAREVVAAPKARRSSERALTILLADDFGIVSPSA